MDLQAILQSHSQWLAGVGGERASLHRGNLSWAILRGADLSGADLRGADVSGADLRDADLRDADLRGGNLSWAILRGADLRGADLRDADLRDADLRGGNLSWAILRGADLIGADLRGADVSGADLSGADLSGAILRDADLSGATLDDMYSEIPTSLEEVREVILTRQDRLRMSSWHGDDEWRNGVAVPVDSCGTAHCLAGWAHHLAALRRPELLVEKVNVYLVGRLSLGEEAAKHFFDDNEDVLTWLKGLES